MDFNSICWKNIKEISLVCSIKLSKLKHPHVFVKILRQSICFSLKKLRYRCVMQ